MKTPMKKMDGPKRPTAKMAKKMDEPKRIESKKPKPLTMVDSTLYKAKKAIKEGDVFGGMSMAKQAFKYDTKGMSDKDILKDKLSGTPFKKKVMPRPEKTDPKSVSYMKSNGSRSISTSEPRVNITPKKGQENMKIKTYEKGKLVMKEKQGKDLLGRPFVKTKTTGEGGFKKGVEKKTLTKSGVKTKSTY